MPSRRRVHRWLVSAAWIASGCGSSVAAHDAATMPDVAALDARFDASTADAVDARDARDVDGTADVASDVVDAAAPPDASLADASRDTVPDGPCAPGFVPCGERCVDTLTDPMNCGHCGLDCASLPQVVHADRATCVAGVCDLGHGACAADFAHCTGDVSVAGCETYLFDPLNCGACGVVCDPEHSLCRTLAGGSGFACVSGCEPTGDAFCNGACANTRTDVDNCGGCGTRCSAGPFMTPICGGGVCGPASCDPGFHLCGGACADSRAPATCGASCAPCVAPANALAMCDGARCGFVCAPFFARAGDACVPVTAPRPVRPLATARVTSHAPVLRWELAPGTDGARVEFCHDRACTAPFATLDATGTHATPLTPVAPGVVFWRLRGRTGATVGSDVSPTWQFTVGARDAPHDADRLGGLDANGDGLADALVGSSSSVFEYSGATGGIGASQSWVYTDATAWSDAGNSVSNAGDVDGDGYADVLVGNDGTFWAGASVPPSAGRALLFAGGPGGPSAAPVTVLTTPDRIGDGFGAVVAGVGDVDGDGYGDVYVAVPGRAHGYVYRGGRTGLGSTPASTLTASPIGIRQTIGAGDVNADGFGDVITADGAHAYVYLGGPGGLTASPAVVIDAPDGPHSRFGDAITVGDFDGDGYGDVALGAWCVGATPPDYGRCVAGRVYVFAGGASGPATMPDTTLSTAFIGDEFGAALSADGDVDGDGFDDLLVGAPWDQRVDVYLGSATGLGSRAAAALHGPDPGSGASEFGGAVRIIGDDDGDGHDDAIVGDWGRGNAYYYEHGSRAGFPAMAWPPAFEHVVLTPGVYLESYGVSVARGTPATAGTHRVAGPLYGLAMLLPHVR